MSWAAVVGGVASVAGGYLSSKKGQSASTGVELPPWLQSQLEEIPSLAKGRILDRELMAPEDIVADLNPQILNALSQMQDYSQGTGQNIMQQLMGAGGGVGAFQSGQNLIEQAAGRGPAIDQGPDMDRVAGMAESPYLDSMVDAALRDPTRQLTEQDIPAARMAQAISGNTGSTRGAMGEAVLQRGYEDRAADIGASIRGSQYDRALGLEAGRSARNAGLESQFQQTLGGLGTNLAGTGVQGANILQLANQIGLGNIDTLMGAGDIFRDYEQKIKGAERLNYEQPVTDLQTYADMLGNVANPYTGNRTTTQGGNGVSGAMAGLSTWLGSDMAGDLFSGGGNATTGQGGGQDFYQNSINFLDPDTIDLLPRS